MRHNNSGFAILEGIIIAIVVIAAGISGYLLWHHHQAQQVAKASTCTVPPSVQATQNYDEPCDVVITVPYGTAQSIITKMIQPINGKIILSLPDSGVYGISFPAGTKDKAIKYLRSQKLVTSVAPDYCCYQDQSSGGAQ